MPRYSSADVGFLLVSGRNILGQTTQLQDAREAIIEETTVLGSTWEQQSYVGVRRYELSQQGFFDDAVDGANDALITPGSSKVLSFALEGNAVGKKFVGTPALQVSYERLIERAALHKANASYANEGGHEEGVILHALGAETGASGNTEGASSQDAGALSSNGGAGYLQVTSLTLGGYTNFAVKVRHSSDDVTYADLVTFTAVTAAPNGQRVAVTGTVNRHLAHSWAFTGAGAGQSATYFVGFARN